MWQRGKLSRQPHGRGDAFRNNLHGPPSGAARGRQSTAPKVVLRIACNSIEDYIKSLFSPTEPAMRYSTQVKSISYLKAHAADVLLQLAEQREPLVITQNGEAKAVLQDVASFEETQETLALLKILALGNRDVEAGKVRPVAEVVARLRSERATG